MENKQVESIEKMLQVGKSEDLLKKSFLIFSINKDNWVSRIFILILSAVLAFAVGYLNTVNILNDIIPLVLDITLAIFGIVFTGYAFFQALLSEEYTSILMEDIAKDNCDKEYQNTLHKTNINFVQLMMQFLVSIFVTLVLKIGLSCMPENFLLFNDMWLNITTASIFILIYFFHLLVVLWRMIGFVFNMYQLFNSYAVTNYVSSVKRKKEK